MDRDYIQLIPPYLLNITVFVKGKKGVGLFWLIGEKRRWLVGSFWSHHVQSGLSTAWRFYYSTTVFMRLLFNSLHPWSYPPYLVTFGLMTMTEKWSTFFLFIAFQFISFRFCVSFGLLFLCVFRLTFIIGLPAVELFFLFLYGALCVHGLRIVFFFIFLSSYL